MKTTWRARLRRLRTKVRMIDMRAWRFRTWLWLIDNAIRLLELDIKGKLLQWLYDQRPAADRYTAPFSDDRYRRLP